MEYITKNNLYEEIRISQGVVLKIRKYKYLLNNRFYAEELKGRTKKIGEKLYELKESIVKNDYFRGELTFPKGTYIINNYPVEKCDQKDYYFELTTTGGSLGGTKEETIRILNKVIEQIKKIDDCDRVL